MKKPRIRWNKTHWVCDLFPNPKSFVVFRGEGSTPSEAYHDCMESYYKYSRYKL